MSGGWDERPDRSREAGSGTPPSPALLVVLATVVGAVVALGVIGTGLAGQMTRVAGGWLGESWVGEAAGLAPPVVLAAGIALAAWMAWMVVDEASLVVQGILALVAMALVVTGGWVFRMHGWEFPVGSVLAFLGGGFAAGQVAAGFAGPPEAAMLRGLLWGHAPAADVLAAVADRSWLGQPREAGVILIEAPDDDTGFLPTLERGLVADGAWCSMDSEGRLRAVFGLWNPEGIEATDRVVDRLRAVLAERRPGWKWETGRGVLVAQVGPRGGIAIRGAVLSRCAFALDTGDGDGKGGTGEVQTGNATGEQADAEGPGVTPKESDP